MCWTEDGDITIQYKFVYILDFKLSWTSIWDLTEFVQNLESIMIVDHKKFQKVFNSTS